MRFLDKIRTVIQKINSIDEKLNKVQQSIGRLEKRQISIQKPKNFVDHEFQVFSQWGEDGLIQYIIENIKIEKTIFVEFGVDKYLEASTRFLLINNNWSGLVMDGSEQNINLIKKEDIYWRYNLKAECAFIDKNNINALITNNGISGDIGLLSVDIDGNDYWVWDSINVINPRIVICEYNSLWGPNLALSTPYDPAFVRTKAHYSNLYYGASISALTKLGNSKGYSLIGSNSAGNNIFFVRNDLVENFNVVKPHEAWVNSQFSETRNENGQLTFISREDRIKLLADMPIINTDDGKKYFIKEVL